MAYEKYAQEIAIIFGADAIAAFNDIQDIVDFEIEIANVRASFILFVGFFIYFCILFTLGNSYMSITKKKVLGQKINRYNRVTL